jgi:hypothetical protein
LLSGLRGGLAAGLPPAVQGTASDTPVGRESLCDVLHQGVKCHAVDSGENEGPEFRINVDLRWHTGAVQAAVAGHRVFGRSVQRVFEGALKGR